jgi:hypothetical protein
MTLEDWGFGLERVEIDNEVVRRVTGRLDVPFGQCSDDMLADALEKVDDHFARVLVVEQLDHSIATLERTLRTRLPPLGHINVNESRAAVDDIEPAVVARVRELNHLDVAFYEAMVERLHASAGR